MNRPLHSDQALAKRLERTEARSSADYVKSRTAAYPETKGDWIDVGGTYAMFDGVGSPCTQSFGLGVFAPVTEVQLVQLEDFFKSRGADVAHEVCPLAEGIQSDSEEPGFVPEMLVSRGYRPVELSNVLFRVIAPTGASSDTSAIHVRALGPGEEPLWAKLAAEGWRDVYPEMEEYLNGLSKMRRDLTMAPLFVAEKDGVPIACGASSLQDDVTLLAGACTVPEARRQGAQLALLNYRLQFAAERGCSIAMIVTQPGSSSQRNAERHGFQVAYTRTRWCLNV